MNRLFSALLALFLLSAPFFASARSGPIKVWASFQKIYVPGGYDSNDRVEIVGEGRFKNSCFRLAETKVQIDAQNKKIYLSPVAYEYSGDCLQVTVGFEKNIDVGILGAGTWEVIQGSGPTKLGAISIRETVGKNADDYLYAPVSQAFYHQQGAISKIVVSGDFPSDCFKLEQVKMTVEPSVLVLQPVVQFESRVDCKEGKFPFVREIVVNAVPAGRYLLHVRSLNGNSVNSLVDIN